MSSSDSPETMRAIELDPGRATGNSSPEVLSAMSFEKSAVARAGSSAKIKT
nr:hypothetical protein [Nocardia asiatica]